MTVDIAGRTGIVTGATRGIGAAICAALAEQRVNLAITGRDSEALSIQEKALLERGIRVLAIQADLMDPESPGRIVSQTSKYFGSLDILVNNAGVGRSGGYADLTVSDWEAHMTVNARAPFFLCQQAVPYLCDSDGPVIINIASVTATRGYPEQAAYSASKHALLGWTKSLAKELHETGIRIHTISPGGVATDMIQAVRPDIDTSEMINPWEIAELVIFLLTHSGNGMIDEIAMRRERKTPWL
ncbi:MAG: SDR family oxidoreductase [Spirochaetales bacterium]|jgi:3-oxoacyl-[acyl-carrier protein] reductase|nr:SDR family oxidoreductase [Spirochaetales bacterium]